MDIIVGILTLLGTFTILFTALLTLVIFLWYSYLFITGGYND